MGRKTGFTLIALFVVPALLFGALEGVLFLVGVPRFVRTDEGNHITSFQDCRFGKSELSHCAPVSERTRKTILVYGESTVEGYPLPQEKRFTSVLQKRLETRAPGQYRVVNYGVSCKDSFFIAECVRRSVNVSPSAVVLYAGHNDFTNNFNPRSLAVPFRNSAWLPHVLVYLRRYSRLYSVLASAAIKARGEQAYPFASMEEYQARHQVVVDGFLTRLDEIRRLAEGAGAQFLLFVPGSNLQFRTEERRLRSDVFKHLKAQSWNFLEAGNRELKAGKWQESLSLYRQARDIDPVPSRATSAFNESLRAYALQHPEIRLVDFDRLLDTRYGPEGIGCNLFGDKTYCDQMHPNAAMHELLAELVLAQLMAPVAPLNP